MISYDDAKKIMMDVAAKPADVSWDEIHTVIQATYSEQTRKNADLNPPLAAPYVYPPDFPNAAILSGINNVNAGIYIQELYVIALNYGHRVWELNDLKNKSAALYNDEYRDWRGAFVDRGVAVDPPIPLPFRVPLTFAEYSNWWRSLEQPRYQTLPDPPEQWSIPKNVSSFDFSMAVKTKANELAIRVDPLTGARGSEQVKSQPSLGDLEKQ